MAYKGFRENRGITVFDSTEGGDGSHKRSERQRNTGCK